MRVLVVSPHFPPVNAPDLQRVRMALPEWLELGWKIHVLACRPDAHSQSLEPDLLATIPAEVEVTYVAPWPLALTAPLGLRNLGWRALPRLARAGSRLLAAARYDAVIFSTTQFICLPLGRLWRARHGVPYVLDLQDPWVSDFYERPGAPPPPGGWKHRFAQLSARLLEGWTLRRAGAVVAVSPAYLQDLRARYPWFPAIRSAVIPFGASPRDFAHAARSPTEKSPRREILYLGRVGDDMQPALDVFLGALAAANAALASPWTARFLGTSYAPAGEARTPIRRVAEAHGVDDAVEETTGRIGYLDSLARLARAEAILVLGSTDLAYAPSKMYPALLSSRPLLVVAPAGGELAVLATRQGVSVRDDEAGIVRWLHGPPAAPPFDESITAARKAREFAAVVEEACR